MNKNNVIMERKCEACYEKKVEQLFADMCVFCYAVLCADCYEFQEEAPEERRCIACA